MSRESLDKKDFEFVLVDAKALQNIKSDVSAFADYFDCDHEKSVTSFLNLGGNFCSLIGQDRSRDLNIAL